MKEPLVSVNQVVIDPPRLLKLMVVQCGTKHLHQLVLTSHHNLRPTSLLQDTHGGTSPDRFVVLGMDDIEVGWSCVMQLY